MKKPEFRNVGRLYDVDIMSDVDIEQGCDAMLVVRLPVHRSARLRRATAPAGTQAR
jgi:hypothetical protein